MSDYYGEVKLRPKKVNIRNPSGLHFGESQTHRLDAYKEDLAEWLAGLFNMNITADSLLGDLENGVRLCQLATMIAQGEEGKPNKNPIPAPPKYNPRPEPGSFKARDNVASFLQWVRGYNMSESVIFEAGDLIDNKRQQNVLYCLMDLGRRQVGVNPPLLIEIERNIVNDRDLTPSEKAGLEFDIDTLLRMVNKEYLVPEYVGGRDYKFGNIGPFKIVKLRDHLMVRTQVGWDTLEHVLSTQSPSNSGTGRVRRRNSIVQDTVNQRERRMSIQTALENFRPPSRSSIIPPETSNADVFRSVEETSSSNDGEKTTLELENKKLNEDLSRLKRDLSMQKQLAAEEQQRVMELQSELQDAAGMEMEMEKNNDMVKSLEQEKNALTLKLSTTKQRLTDEHKEQLREVGQHVDLLTQEKKNLEAKLRDAEEKAATLNSNVGDILSLEHQLAEAKAALEGLRLELQAQRESFEEQLRVITEKHNALVDKMEMEHDDEIHELEEEIASLRASRVEAVNEAAEKSRELLQQQVEELAANMEHQSLQHEQEMSSLASAHEESFQAIKVAHENELKTLTVSQSKKEENLQAELQKTIDELRKQVSVAEMEKQHTASKTLLTQLQVEMEELVAKHAKELKAANTKREEAEHALATTQGGLSTCTESLSSTKSQISELKSKLVETEVQQRNAMATLKEELSAALLESRQFQERARDAEDKASSLDSRVSLLSKQLEDSKDLFVCNAELQRASTESSVQVEALKSKLESVTRKLDTYKETNATLTSQLSDAIGRARDAELKVSEAETAAESARTLLQEEHANNETMLSSLREQIAGGIESERKAMEKEKKELEEDLLRVKDKVGIKEGEVSDAMRQLNESLLNVKREEANARRLRVEMENMKALADGEKAALESKVANLERALKTERDEADQRIQSVEAKMQQSFKVQMASYENDIARMKETIDSIRVESDNTSFNIQTTTAEKLRDAQKRVDEVETNALARKQRLESEIKDLKLTCMELERKEGSVQLEKDMLNQKLTATESKHKALLAEYDALKGRHKADVRSLEEKLVEGAARSDATKTTMLPRPFSEMTLPNLTPQDVDVICLYDNEARVANVNRLKAHASLNGAVSELAFAEEKHNQESTRDTQEALEHAQSRKYQAETALHDAEVAFHAAASRALANLQKEEERLGLPNGDSIREMILGEHAQAQMRIAELEVALEIHQRRNALAHEDVVAALRRQHMLDMATFNEQRARDAERISALEEQLQTLLAKTLEQEDTLSESKVTLEQERSGNAKELRVFATVADWMNTLLDTNLTPENLMDSLRDGKLLCSLANVVDEVEEGLREIEEKDGPSDEHVITREHQDVTEFVASRELMEVHYLEEALPGSEEATSNITAFIEWAESLGIKYPSIFEKEDLINDEDHRRVAEGILDVAYRVRGLPLPEEVEAHRSTADIVEQPQQYEHVKGDLVDEKVAEVLHFVPQLRTKLQRVAKGKYRLGGEKRILLMRVLRNQVMVRVGGGWMDLQEYLVSHARRRQTHSKSKQTRDAQEAVSSILNATTGPGLCSTRTKLPGGKKSKRRSPGKVKVTDVKPYAPESNGNFMFK
eukprot:m.41901 g.41901  ORF g.41901 m.41901 type:complete len:1595 (+) comp7028_c0_seq2:206-4990(+)